MRRRNEPKPIQGWGWLGDAAEEAAVQRMAPASRVKDTAIKARFARSLKQLVNALAEMEALGVAFVSLRDNLDLSTPSGRLMFQIIGAMAEFERVLIQERVRAGLRHARAQGKRLGRPGVNVEVKHIRELRAHGASLRTIGVGLGTVHRALPARSKTVSKASVGSDPTLARQADLAVESLRTCDCRPEVPALAEQHIISLEPASVSELLV
jgi:hypothetical protein